MVLFPSGSISGTINGSAYISCCGSNIDLIQQSHTSVEYNHIELLDKNKEE
jgi:hypothetical protein